MSGLPLGKLVLCMQAAPGTCMCDASVALQVPHLRPFPQPYSVLVLDNCATHHTAAFTGMIEATGALTVFLPPYSPELNPVRMLFLLMMGVLCR